jgi:short-subunit dehydrogenase
MKTALITGASNGIGLELAKQFAENKINLVLVARNRIKLHEISNELSKTFNVKCFVIATDLSDYNNAEEIFKICKNENIQIDYLINNAGFGDYGFFHESDWKKQVEMINLNITSLTYLTHLFLPDMIQNKNGRILNVASIAAFLPGPLMSVYYATKAFVLSFSEALSNELKDKNITVTTLCPGPTESNFFKRADMVDSKFVKGRKLPSSTEVAIYGYNQMMKGKRIAIPGILNNLMIYISRFVPRGLVLKTVRIAQSK